MGELDNTTDKGPGTENKKSSPPVLDEKKETGTNYIIAIGIDEYKNASLNLPNCVKDCKDVIKTFETGFQKFQVYKMLYNEEATRQGIIDAIDSFCDDEKCNNPFNTLVIYFSGHGGFVKAPGRDIGSWIPYDYVNNAKNEFLRLDDLKKNLEFIETLHLLVIADCCFSESMFQNDIAIFDKVDNLPIDKLVELDFEPSRWGIASSRKNQVSGAGQPGGNSNFTKELIKALQGISTPRVMFRKIADELIDKFRDNPIQRVRYKELHVSNNNTGEYTLYANEEPLKARRRYDYLKQEFINLNYDDQRKQFRKFRSAQPALFTLLSGTTDCGLNYVIGQLKESKYFTLPKPWPINAQLVEGTNEQRLINLFKMAAKGEQDFHTIDDLKKHLVKKLHDADHVIEIRFNAQTDSLGDVTNMRKNFIETLARFSESVNREAPRDKRLYIFIIDFENIDYPAIIPDIKISQTEAIIFDKVKKLSDLDFLDWYDKAQLRCNTLSGEEKEFCVLFDKILYDQVKVIFPDSEEMLPGYVIRKICLLSGCPELADELLN